VAIGAGLFLAIVLGTEGIAVGRALMNMRSDGALVLGAALVLMTVTALWCACYWLAAHWRRAPKG
jgi:hypothetical protein